MEEFITTIIEFDKFINFIENEQPVLSAKHGVLGKKDSYKLNQLLDCKKEVNSPNYNMDQYQVIDLMFSLALSGKLYVKANREDGKPALVETEILESYKTLNQHEKYVFLLQTYWTKYDFDEKLDKFITVNALCSLLVSIADAEVGQKIIKNSHGTSDLLYSAGATFFHHLRFFGVGDIEEDKAAKGRYEDTIKVFIPSNFGIHISKFLLNKALAVWNHIGLSFMDSKLKLRYKTKKIKNPFDVFKEIFEDGSVSRTVDEEKEFDRSGVYTFKVNLFKSCWRKINVSHRNSLSDLHLAIQKAYDFDNDHLYAFYIGGNHRNGKPIYCAEMDDDEKTTEETTIEDMGLYKGQKFYYLFDFGDKWEFDIELIKIDKDMPLSLKPVIIETKGESPEQYPCWEDEDE